MAFELNHPLYIGSELVPELVNIVHILEWEEVRRKEEWSNGKGEVVAYITT